MPRRLRRLLIPISALVATGCLQHSLRPVDPVTLRLVSPEPFEIHVPATRDSAANRCAHLRVEARVADVRGDTMFFDSVRSDKRPRGIADCVAGREGYLLLSGAPALRAETLEFHPWRTALYVLVGGTVAVLAAIYVMLSGTA